ncbi:MAG: flagellar biosynthesis/type III secretory pathway protein FliH [Psychrobacter glaciei]|jgi:flagellar biosynthesis/type III secretory pathway protein FliH
MLPLTRITLTEYDLITYDKVIPASAFIVSRTASKIIDDAQQLAKDIIKNAEQQYQLKSDQGYQDGLIKWELKKESEVESLNIEIKQHINKLHKNLTNSVMQITRKIMGSINESDLLSGLVNQAINHLSTECILNLRISPENADIAKQVTQDILAINPTIEGFNIIVDPGLLESDYLLEHPDGTHDIGAETQLNNLTDLLNNTHLR